MADDKPIRFSEQTIKHLLDNDKSVVLNLENAEETNYQNTGSFFYDLPGSGLKSTQQLNVDWSKFENHTFFNSAEVNVNIAFHKIINNFPFDGTKKEYEKFFENLTGFEKYVLEQFPKNTGYLHFSGTAVGETLSQGKGTTIIVKDYAGNLYPEISKIKTGEIKLDPQEKSFTFDFHMHLPVKTNNVQVIFQRTYDTVNGYTFFLKNTTSTTYATGVFVVHSGSNYMTSSMSIPKGTFNNIVLTYDKDNKLPQLKTYLNATQHSISDTNVVMGNLPTLGTYLTIGSGSKFNIGSDLILPLQTFSGSLDEFRFFHSTRTQKQIEGYRQKNIYPTDTLKLYYKFNEPSGALNSDSNSSINRIVLDSSGNSLHSLIESNGFWSSLRKTGSTELANPITYERDDLSPILFTNFPSVNDLNEELLSSASLYDEVNPNLITRLIPQHYLIDGQYFDGFNDFKGTMSDVYSIESIPGSGKMGSTQLMLSFLYVWAKYFDELKLFIDSFSKMNFVDYDTNDTIPDNFLLQMFKTMGFNVPPMFLDASIEQYIDAENIEFKISRGAESLQSIQNQILRKVLISLRYMIGSKGTLRSVKSFFRAMGIDPNNSFRIREYGGPDNKQLDYAREDKIEPISFLQFNSSSYFTTPYLSSSRTEVGFPYSVGTFVQKENYNPHGISNTNSDGLLTSGSWTYEGLYKYKSNKKILDISQSLAKIEVLGSNTSTGGFIFNMVSVSGSSKVKLFGRPTADTTITNAPLLELSIDANIFDGNIWNISFGRSRGDKNGYFNSSSYFLRAASNVDEVYENSAWFREIGNSSNSLTSNNSIERIITTNNLYGPFIRIGAHPSIKFGTASGYLYLNNTTTITNSLARANQFEGQISNVRFWSKDLSLNEWKEHVRNYKSLGVVNPIDNFNFNKASSGSFERLRVDININQSTKKSDNSGNITLFDYSQNSFHGTGNSFTNNTTIISGDTVVYSTISPYYDEAITNEKIRVRSYQDASRVINNPYASQAPLYRLPLNETPMDDTRFSIDFSLVDALNRDMVLIFSELSKLDNIIGSPELMYSMDYPGLENLRDIYFNRLTEKLNFKSFFEFFRWFERSIGFFIDQLLPRNLKYLGTNFVVESHIFERPKVQYYNNEMYLHDKARVKERVLLLQQIVGKINKY
jgi:hypothetical protein